jgi:hypothetical protein
VVQTWLDCYVAAWRSYDRQAILDLFSAEATYAYHPWGEPLRGAESIADDWLAEPDRPGSWEASYRPLLIEGNKAITSGTSTYSDGRVFHNLWEVDFDDQGRCSRFVEWYMCQEADM